MTNYEKRNEREEADLQPDAELLVRGEFKDDEDDEGYTTTRWLGLNELWRPRTKRSSRKRSTSSRRFWRGSGACFRPRKCERARLAHRGCIGRA